MHLNHFLVLVVVSIISTAYTQEERCPPGWSLWKDEQCYSLVTFYATFQNAQEMCASRGGSVATVKEEEQQTFLTNLVFNESSVEIGVWIGATRVSETDFEWADGSLVEYANWAIDSPSATDGKDCVAMQSRLQRMEDEDGKWKDLSCNTPNYFVCETRPSWSVEDILEVLLATRKALNKTKEDLDTTKEELKSTNLDLETTKADLAATDNNLQETIATLGKTDETLRNVVSNPVPIGFIYTQYSGQPDPTAIWPGVSWKDITANYAGLFFRAEGGNSAPFGTVQDADSPRVTYIENADTPPYAHAISIPAGEWSEYLYTGYNNGLPVVATRFFTSNPEIRPNNTAIRVWVREA